MKVDGKFMAGADIPEGQGSVMQLLSECFDLSYELRVDAQEKEVRAEKVDKENGVEA